MAVRVKAFEERAAQAMLLARDGQRSEHTSRGELLTPWRSMAIEPKLRAPQILHRCMLALGSFGAGDEALEKACEVRSHDGIIRCAESRASLLKARVAGPRRTCPRRAVPFGERRIDDGMPRSGDFMPDDATRVVREIYLVLW